METVPIPPTVKPTHDPYTGQVTTDHRVIMADIIKLRGQYAEAADSPMFRALDYLIARMRNVDTWIPSAAAVIAVHHSIPVATAQEQIENLLMGRPL